MGRNGVLDMFRLDGKAAIVTGGSKGLGKAIAVALAQAGADVVLSSGSRQEIECAAREVEAEGGKKAIPVPADVRSWEDAERVRDVALKALGRIDILVNSAGMNNRKPIADLSVEEFDELVDTTLTR